MMSTEQMIVNSQLARIHILLSKIDKVSVKADYVIDVTNGREHSTRGLSFEEANRMIRTLEQEERELFREKRNSADVQRKKIISCFREMGYIKSGKADMQRIYGWVLKYGYLHKPLNQYTLQELPKLVSQVELVKKDFLNRI